MSRDQQENININNKQSSSQSIHLQQTNYGDQSSSIYPSSKLHNSNPPPRQQQASILAVSSNTDEIQSFPAGPSRRLSAAVIVQPSGSAFSDIQSFSEQSVGPQRPNNIQMERTNAEEGDGIQIEDSEGEGERESSWS